jgi:BirA family transcriptional regulator, biotin operon repressor / biotin---[acetyl-CoA-carboxylase] ligase
VTPAGEAVQESVSPLLPGFTVEFVPEIDSTNTELMRRARSGRTQPVLLVADAQTAGRGRLGRNWTSAPGDSLTFSVGLALSPADWSGLSLAVGVALAESLHPQVRIKWPNDLWVNDRKLAGILIETATSTADAKGPRYAVIGVGVNIAAPTSSGLSTPPAALQDLLPDARAHEVLMRVARPLIEAVKAFESFGFGPFQARFDARDALRDRPVVLSDGTAGTAHGTTAAGGLLVHTAAGMVAVTSSEVSVRPAA